LGKVRRGLGEDGRRRRCSSGFVSGSGGLRRRCGRAHRWQQRDDAGVCRASRATKKGSQIKHFIVSKREQRGEESGGGATATATSTNGYGRQCSSPRQGGAELFSVLELMGRCGVGMVAKWRSRKSAAPYLKARRAGAPCTASGHRRERWRQRRIGWPGRCHCSSDKLCHGLDARVCWSEVREEEGHHGGLACTVASSRSRQLFDENPAALLGRVCAGERGEGLVRTWVEWWRSARPTIGGFSHRKGAWGGQCGRVHGDAPIGCWGSTRSIDRRGAQEGGLGGVGRCSDPSGLLASCA
jgi:hypothetical protein